MSVTPHAAEDVERVARALARLEIEQWGHSAFADESKAIEDDVNERWPEWSDPARVALAAMPSIEAAYQRGRLCGEGRGRKGMRRMESAHGATRHSLCP